MDIVITHSDGVVEFHEVRPEPVGGLVLDSYVTVAATSEGGVVATTHTTSARLACGDLARKEGNDGSPEGEFARKRPEAQARRRDAQYAEALLRLSGLDPDLREGSYGRDLERL